MSLFFLAKGFRVSRIRNVSTTLFLPSTFSRAASLNSAINKGIRRSRGVGFRERDGGRDGPSRGTFEDGGRASGDRMSRGREGGRASAYSKPSSHSRSTDSRPGSKPRGAWEGGSSARTGGLFRQKLKFSRNDGDDYEDRGSSPRSFHSKDSRPKRDWRETDSPQRSGFAGGRSRPYERETSDRRERPASRTRFNDWDTPDRRQRPTSRGSYGRDMPDRRGKQATRTKSYEWDVPDRKERSLGRKKPFEWEVLQKDKPASRESSIETTSREDFESKDVAFTEERFQDRDDRKFQSRPRDDDGGKYNQRYFPQGPRPDSHGRENDTASASNPRFTTSIDKRIPISIPYTTPASEFLYGTSVVQAALNSKRPTRRKLYKFYIYEGANRQEMVRDDNLERLAFKNGVEVVRVKGDFLRVMDKITAGRPHNGYILEASPLPRLPIKSLGELETIDEKYGYSVVPDTQTREELAINGNNTFFELPIDSSRPLNMSRKKPLILLLDGIEDPGNLGGIIRTASFLGATAVAISTHSSASFTPVVLKASVGATENMTLFAVSKPSGFMVESKRVGWKIYAAVAPGKTEGRKSYSVNEIEDPLTDDPCILMLGGEGGGLRKGLREKADVEVWIPGSGQRFGVDSLNVNVAAGILCSGFLTQKTGRGQMLKVGSEGEGEGEVEISPPERDLF